MSSESCGNPAVENEATMSRRAKYDKSKFCIKCKINTGRIVVRHAVYCKDCFPALLGSKVKRSLDSHINTRSETARKKSLKASGNLLIGFSGGLGSTVLLDLISKIYLSTRTENHTGGRGGKDHPRNEPVWKEASVCYVEISAGFPGMKDRTDEMKLLVEEKYPSLQFIPLRLEDAFDRTWWDKLGGDATLDATADVTNEDLFLSTISDNATSDAAHKLRTYISALPTHTAIASAIRTLTRLLLLHTARLTHSSHLLLGTSLTSLSITLISSISQGGGFSVREEAQEEWKPNPSTSSNSSGSIRLVRPLQEITMKECAMWAWWNDLRVMGKEAYPGSKQGIGALTKDFIVGLERDYPSTVSTIARTCAKLAPKVGAEGVCVLCERPLQPGVQEWKSRISIRSTTEPLSRPPNPSPSSLLHSLTPHLCYSCHTTLTSRSSKAVSNSAGASTSLPLPIWASTRLLSASSRTDVDKGDVWPTHRVGPDEMKMAIGEFLLEQSS